MIIRYNYFFHILLRIQESESNPFNIHKAESESMCYFTHLCPIHQTNSALKFDIGIRFGYSDFNLLSFNDFMRRRPWFWLHRTQTPTEESFSKYFWYLGYAMTYSKISFAFLLVQSTCTKIETFEILEKSRNLY